MTDNKMFLYSINCKLAYEINRKYYGKHYVWCTSHFDTNMIGGPTKTNPPTSNPKEIIGLYLHDKKAWSDDHLKPYYVIERINGISLGAEQMRSEIGEPAYSDVVAMIERAKEMKFFDDFDPLLYIISYEAVKTRVESVPCKDKARLYSEEYRITDLHDNEFDVINVLDVVR